MKSDNGNIQIPVSIFIGEGRVNIAEICSGLSTRDEHRESWGGVLSRFRALIILLINHKSPTLVCLALSNQLQELIPKTVV